MNVNLSFLSGDVLIFFPMRLVSIKRCKPTPRWKEVDGDKQKDGGQTETETESAPSPPLFFYRLIFGEWHHLRGFLTFHSAPLGSHKRLLMLLLSTTKTNADVYNWQSSPLKRHSSLREPWQLYFFLFLFFFSAILSLKKIFHSDFPCWGPARINLVHNWDSFTSRTDSKLNAISCSIPFLLQF